VLETARLQTLWKEAQAHVPFPWLSLQQGEGFENLAWLIVVTQEPFPFPWLAPHKGVEYLSLT